MATSETYLPKQERVITARQDDQNSEIMVSIFCLTYNHIEYIRDALDGFLSQCTNFLYEIVIFDDASTDGTSDVILKYAQKYPQIVRAVISPQNTFYLSERPEILMKFLKENLKGKYVACCEGDDYWIDHHKLQIQVDYMENTPDCSLYLHNALWIDCHDGAMKEGNPYESIDEKNLTPEEVIMQYKGHPPTASIICKKELYLESIKFFRGMPAGDYAVQLYALSKGTVHYNNRIMSVYRWHSKGSYNGIMSKNKKLRFNFFLEILCHLALYDQYTNDKYHIWITNKIQYFISVILSEIDKDVSIISYYEQCVNEGYYFSPICEKHLEKLEILRHQTLDIKYCSEDLKSFVSKYSYIIVMGIGRYGALVAEQLKNNQIDITGFAVSQKGEWDVQFKGKPVWKLSELPFDRYDIGIIIAINPVCWNSILQSLEQAKIINYICPFLLISR